MLIALPSMPQRCTTVAYFVDVIGRMAKADTDVAIDGTKKGTLDNVALSVSGELGWRFDVTDSFYLRTTNGNDLYIRRLQSIDFKQWTRI